MTGVSIAIETEQVGTLQTPHPRQLRGQRASPPVRDCIQGLDPASPGQTFRGTRPSRVFREQGNLPRMYPLKSTEERSGFPVHEGEWVNMSQIAPYFKQVVNNVQNNLRPFATGDCTLLDCTVDKKTPRSVKWLGEECNSRIGNPRGVKSHLTDRKKPNRRKRHPISFWEIPVDHVPVP
ncbi:hypothetical protein VTN96DRAFT_7276 [Rasamsonia emersonii]